jgi:hypothetical protein
MPDETKEVPLHTIEDIVTPGPHNATRRMRVAGGWIYWIEAAGGTFVSSFVPDPPGETS